MCGVRDGSRWTRSSDEYLVIALICNILLLETGFFHDLDFVVYICQLIALSAVTSSVLLYSVCSWCLHLCLYMLKWCCWFQTCSKHFLQVQVLRLQVQIQVPKYCKISSTCTSKRATSTNIWLWKISELKYTYMYQNCEYTVHVLGLCIRVVL